MSQCLTNVITLDVSYNTISEFPSAMIYNMPTLENLYFHHNQLVEVPSNAFSSIPTLSNIDFSYNLLTTFELWTFLVRTSVDFSYNQISTITNKNVFALPTLSIIQPPLQTIRLNNNGATINLTDAVYEMYNACREVTETFSLPGADGTYIYPLTTLSLANVDFGATQINCNCDQSYILQMFQAAVAQIDLMTGYPIYNATCTTGGKFLFSSCAPNNTANAIQPNSSVDFTRVYPRQCKISQEELGSLTESVNISVPTFNTVRNEIIRLTYLCIDSSSQHIHITKLDQ